MQPSLVDSAYAFWIVITFGALFALIYVAWMAGEAVPRLRAGPIRFRLPLASLAKGSNAGLRFTAAAIGFALVPPLLIVSNVRSSDDSLRLAFLPILFLWVAVTLLLGTSRRWSNPHRDARRWRVLASGLLALVMGAAALAFGFRALVISPNPMSHPAGPLILISVVAFARGAASLREYRLGTLVFDRGIEVFGTFLPWSRVVVEDWQPCEGGFDLALAIRSPRRFGIPVVPDGEVIVPVPALERPGLEAFLAANAAAAG